MSEPCSAALLDAWLAGRPAMAEEEIAWSLDPPMRLQVVSILADTLPPESCISSVRAVVLGPGSVLVVRDPISVHILPGGRREQGETLYQTLTREVLEESGWSVGPPRLLGCAIFTHRDPMPDGYGYPYPRFVQAIYAAQAQQHVPEALEQGGYELEAGMRPLAALAELPLGPSQLAFLGAALRAFGMAGRP